ncbi:MAG: HNH endonuclease [Ktedonobacteraceae bacterium]
MGGYSKQKAGANGLTAACKACNNAISKNRYRTSVERYRENHKAWREANPTYFKQYNQDNAELISEKSRRYRQEHAKRISENKKRYYREHAEQIKALRKTYQQAHAERIRKYRKIRYQEYAEQFKVEKKEYYQEKVELIREKRRKHRKAHPELYVTADKVHFHRRRARKIMAEGSFTKQEWRALCTKYDFRCLCCGRQVPEISLTADHVIPLVMGGSNYIENVQPLCTSCNSSKYNKIIDYRR